MKVIKVSSGRKMQSERPVKTTSLYMTVIIGTVMCVMFFSVSLFGNHEKMRYEDTNDVIAVNAGNNDIQNTMSDKELSFWDYLEAIFSRFIYGD